MVPVGMSTTARARAERKEAVRSLTLTGMPASKIAAKVGISVRTVGHYRAELCAQGRLLFVANHGRNGTAWRGEGRIGDWMQTYTGRAFYPMDPRVSDIDPLDIAHALSMICRYGGHSTRFYSVAEHCVLMSRAVHPLIAPQALLHDATEAYVGDMIRPLKRSMPAYRAAEDRLAVAISERFSLPVLYSPEVKEADSRILLDERAAVLGASPRPWSAYLESLTPLGVTVTGWSPQRAKREYLWRLEELGLR